MTIILLLVTRSTRNSFIWCDFTGFRPESRQSSGIRSVGLPAGWRLNSDVIIDGSSQPLLAAQIPFRGLHTNMSQQELNLLKLSTRQVAEPGAGTALMPHAA
jgi:hypothetical protein